MEKVTDIIAVIGIIIVVGIVAYVKAYSLWLRSVRKLTREEIDILNERMDILYWNIEHHYHDLGLIKYYNDRSYKYFKWISYGIQRQIDIDIDLKKGEQKYKKYELEKQRDYEYEYEEETVDWEHNEDGTVLKPIYGKKRRKVDAKRHVKSA